MSLFTIGDLHLSFCHSKPMDIFPGWNNYTDRLKKNWESIVSDNDTVVIVGDISWAMKLEDAKEDFKFINELPGKKIILKGNHDYWWTTRKKMDEFLSRNSFDSINILFNCSYKVDEFAICGTRGWFYDAETDEDRKILNREVGRLSTSINEAIKLGGEVVAFLHYPPVYAGDECSEIINLLLDKNIKKCYYGHIHGNIAHKRAITGMYKGIDFKMVSGDFINFMPVLVR